MNTTLIRQAREFAHRGHDSIGQIRKYTGEPYWVHTDEVAAIVLAIAIPLINSDFTEDEVIYLGIAANCHDYREDVVTALIKQGRTAELEAFEREYNEFPEPARLLVDELTDVFTPEAYPKWNRAKRKAAEAERISKLSKLAKLIKLADFYSNTDSIVEHDADFAKVYLKEKGAILPHLAGVHDVLYRAVEHQMQNSLDKLSAPVVEC